MDNCKGVMDNGWMVKIYRVDPKMVIGYATMSFWIRYNLGYCGNINHAVFLILHDKAYVMSCWTSVAVFQ